MITAFAFNADACPECRGVVLDLVENVETREFHMACLICGHKGESTMVQNEDVKLWNGGDKPEHVRLKDRIDEIDREIEDLTYEKEEIEKALREMGVEV